MDAQTAFAALQFLSTLALLGVTWWYAKTTALLARTSKEQSEVLELSAEIQARAALAFGRGDNSVTVLAQLAEELARRRQTRASKA